MSKPTKPTAKHNQLYASGFVNTSSTLYVTNSTSNLVFNPQGHVIAARKPRKKRRPPTRPGPKTVAKVIAWLESMDLNVYGPGVDFATGEGFNAHMDYDIEAIEKLAQMIKDGTYEPYLNRID